MNESAHGGQPRKLVLFDLDGVLLDSRENMRLSWQKVRDELGVIVTFESYFKHIGRPFDSIMERLGLSDQVDEIESVFRMASMENIKLVRFYPGVIETLRGLSSTGIRMGIVTSKDKLRTNAILAMLPVKFASVRTPDAGIRGKPAPDHLLAAMAEVGADPAETLYVGDMDADHEAAVRARVDYAHAGWGYGREPKDGSYILKEFGDIGSLVLGEDVARRNPR